jgi:hypothetical protein
MFALQKCDFVLDREDVGPQEKEYVRDVRRRLVSVADELNLQSGNLDRYTAEEDAGGEQIDD